MVAIDTVLGHATNPGATLSAVTMATGDSLTVRYSPPNNNITLERIFRAGTSTGQVRLTSPRLHDNVVGLSFKSAESPTVFLLPQNVGQMLYPQDNLSLSVTGGTAETDLAALGIYYTSLPGSDARLYMPADILPNIKHLHTIEVDITNSGTIGNWTDTAINTTEDQLKANQDYAVLGYVADTAIALVGVKGSDTGNLRICGPGTTNTDDTSQYFVEMALREGTPHIPVFNSANKSSTYVSTADSAASSTSHITLVTALMNAPLS